MHLLDGLMHKPLRLLSHGRVSLGATSEGVHTILESDNS